MCMQKMEQIVIVTLTMNKGERDERDASANWELCMDRKVIRHLARWEGGRVGGGGGWRNDVMPGLQMEGSSMFTVHYHFPPLTNQNSRPHDVSTQRCFHFHREYIKCACAREGVGLTMSPIRTRASAKFARVRLIRSLRRESVLHVADATGQQLLT